MVVQKKLRAFLYKVSRDLTDSDVEGLRFVLSDDLPQAEEAKSSLELFNLMIKQDVIREGNLDKLIEYLREIERQDLVTRCNVYQKLTNSEF